MLVENNFCCILKEQRCCEYIYFLKALEFHSFIQRHWNVHTLLVLHPRRIGSFPLLYRLHHSPLILFCSPFLTTHRKRQSVVINGWSWTRRWRHTPCSAAPQSCSSRPWREDVQDMAFVCLGWLVCVCVCVVRWEDDIRGVNIRKKICAERFEINMCFLLVFTLICSDTCVEVRVNRS